jgi:type II secretory pathway pseudopilin PulG
MAPVQKPTAFSLVEVVIAVGVFALAVVAIVALLPSMTRQAAESADYIAAERLPESVRVELRRLAAGGFDALANQIPDLAEPRPDAFAMVAARDGLRLHSVASPPSSASETLSESEQYFSVEAWRLTDTSLRYETNGPLLAVLVRVSWPYHNPGGGSAVTPLADRSQISFTVSLRR